MILTTDISLGVEALGAGGLVAFPTETVYGLGADATNAEAVAKIFAVKGRPVGHPLIVHVARAEAVWAWSAPNPAEAELMERVAASLWPGPLTIVVPRSDRAAPATVGGLDTIGLRVPSSPVALELLNQFDGGVAAPSANRFGRVSPTRASHVIDDLGCDVDVVIDGGSTEIGVESTIVSLVDGVPILLRPGGVSRAQLETVLERPIADPGQVKATIRAPGTLRSHYSPQAQVELVTPQGLAARIDELTNHDLKRHQPQVGVVAPFPVAHRPSWLMGNDAAGYAHRLYDVLRQADHHGVDRLLVVKPSSGELVEAVSDRLVKAATPPDS